MNKPKYVCTMVKQNRWMRMNVETKTHLFKIKITRLSYYEIEVGLCQAENAIYSVMQVTYIQNNRSEVDAIFRSLNYYSNLETS